MDGTETLTRPQSGNMLTRHTPARNTQRPPQAIWTFLLAAFLLPQLTACSWFEDSFESTQFVGKWQSSRLKTPIQLYSNGEWEIQAPDGSVQQYGVWELVGKDILWSSQSNGQIRHDPNVVLSVSPRQFEVREQNGSVTTFVKLN